MPYSKTRKSSMTDMMATVPVNKGSLLASLENLLKTIESSESAVMIPTLLRDKCEFDAWELLFVAKILKASILGHSDLVEYYMNHVSQQRSRLAAASTPPAGALLRQPSSPALSPAPSHSPSTPTPAPPAATTNYAFAAAAATPTTNGHPTNGSTSLSLSCSSADSISPAATTSGPCSSSSGWATATSQQQQQPQQQSRWPLSGISSPASLGSPASSQATPTTADDAEPARPATSTSPMSAQRQPQPPRLLQLTTTNNHINSSVAGRLTGGGALDPLAGAGSPTGNGHGFEVGLSISTGAAGQPLKPSRSAGCLFRNQSPAASPRTPTTPLASTASASTTMLPQAETLASATGGQLAGDPSAPVKLLLQIEQLKTSIAYVTSQLENVVELYKRSIDNIV